MSRRRAGVGGGRGEAEPRTYGQACGMARALDVIGDRWTMLIVRELLYLGPRRFTDLRDALPGVASNLLSRRLRALQTAGLVERDRLPAPAASAVYRLTELGKALEPVARELLRFGVRLLADSADPDVPVRPELPLIALRAGFRSEAARGVREVYEFRFESGVFRVVVDDGTMEIVAGSGPRADVVVETDLRTFAGMVQGRERGVDAFRAGRLRATGHPAAMQRLLAILGRETAAAPPLDDRRPRTHGHPS